MFAGFGLLISAGPADAHESDVRTNVVLQVGSEQTLALVLYEIPAGTDAATLRSGADIDLDGVLGEEEQARLARQLIRDATAGLRLVRDDGELEVRDLDWSLELQPTRDGAVLLALILEFEGGAGRYTVSTEPEHPGLVLEFEAGAGLRIAKGTAAPSSDGISAGPWQVANGDAVWARIDPVED